MGKKHPFEMEQYEKSDVGTCDGCGEWTNNLSCLGGEWVCDVCVRFG